MDDCDQRPGPRAVHQAVQRTRGQLLEPGVRKVNADRSAFWCECKLLILTTLRIGMPLGFLFSVHKLTADTTYHAPLIMQPAKLNVDHSIGPSS